MLTPVSVPPPARAEGATVAAADGVALAPGAVGGGLDALAGVEAGDAAAPTLAAVAGGDGADGGVGAGGGLGGAAGVGGDPPQASASSAVAPANPVTTTRRRERRSWRGMTQIIRCERHFWRCRDVDRQPPIVRSTNAQGSRRLR